MPTGPDRARNYHPQTGNSHPFAPVPEMAARSNFQTRPWGQYPEREIIGHRRKKIVRVCVPSSGSAGRCPSGGHRQQQQAQRRKTIHGRRYRNGSVLPPGQAPCPCSICRMQPHQAASFLHQNPQPTARSCYPPASDRLLPHPCIINHGLLNVL